MKKHEFHDILEFCRILFDLPSNLPTRSISSVEVPLFIFVLKLILSKLAAFLSEIALCLNSPSFLSIFAKISTFQFLTFRIFVFDFLIFSVSFSK